mgnify:CR=1 FL=1
MFTSRIRQCSVANMKKVLLFLWQLPQNIIGILVVLFCVAGPDSNNVYICDYNFGVSLGNFIIMNKNYSRTDLKHERGHQKQSLYLGWLYLFTIGILSVCGNLYDRYIHRIDYYNQPWEKWADKLGGVVR